jgi:4-aminobutyrate aminotransferase / (S)-3-amino-2-methylpropionate transaminase / 5-aminovalerate transaminase
VTGQDLPRIATEVPGPRSRALAERLAAVECPEVTWQGPPAPLFWRSGVGANLVDVDGNRFVDLGAGFGAAVLGYAHPQLVDALRAQAGELQHAMGDVFPAEQKVLLLEELTRALPGGLGHAILSGSGSDAVESALKTALVATGKPVVVAFEGAYHGLGIGALDATWREDFRHPFLARLAGQTRFVPYGDADAARRAARAGDVGAILFEPIQGRGGLVFPPRGFVAELRRIADEAGALLIADEVYTGLGRTGRWLACEHEGVVPDVVALGKALGGGFPISACVGRPEVMRRWPASTGEAVHTSTHLGNPLGCAAALAVLRTLESDGLVRRADEAGARWLALLGKRIGGHARVRALRGRGLLVAVELDDAGFAREAAARLLRAGWIVLGEGPESRTLALTPALSIAEELLEAAADRLAECLE